MNKGKEHHWMLNAHLLFRTAAVVFSQLSAGIFWDYTTEYHQIDMKIFDMYMTYMSSIQVILL